MKDNETLRRDRHELLFGIRRSIRYHSRRIQFFDRFHLITTALVVIFGSATILAVLSAVDKSYAIGAAAVITVLSVIDLIVGTSKMSRLHESLARRFIELEKKMITTTEEKFSSDDLMTMTAERLGIEADEPPVLRVLDSLCQNELLRAMGYGREEFLRIAWYQRMVAQFIDIMEYRITKAATEQPKTSQVASSQT